MYLLGKLQMKYSIKKVLSPQQQTITSRIAIFAALDHAGIKVSLCLHHLSLLSVGETSEALARYDGKDTRSKQE